MFSRGLSLKLLPPAFLLRDECFALAPSIFGKCLKRALSLPRRPFATPAMVNIARTTAEMRAPAYRIDPGEAHDRADVALGYQRAF